MIRLISLEGHERPTVSVITCFNDRETLDANLRASIKVQRNVPFELLGFDNTLGSCSSIPRALNSAASCAAGDILVFAHQDVFLIGRDWFSKMMEHLRVLDKFGAAGVAGVDSQGQRHGFIVDRGRLWGKPFSGSRLVQTIDEQLLITPRALFLQVRFDEHFKFHSYSADYCLSLSNGGSSVYVIPLPVEHNSITVGVLKASNMKTEDQYLLKKHTRYQKTIRKTTGTVSTFGLFSGTAISVMNDIIFTIPTVFLSSKFAREEPNVILDVGCIPLEQPTIAKIVTGSYSVGVSPNLRYLFASKHLATHSDYVCAAPHMLPFRSAAIGTILVFGLLEYFPKPMSTPILSGLENIGKALIVKVPCNCSRLDFTHFIFRSCWIKADFRGKGYRVFLIGPNGRLMPHFLLAIRRRP